MKKPEPILIICVGTIAWSVQAAMAERINPYGIANYCSTATEALQHEQGFSHNALLAARIKKATRLALCAHESEAENAALLAGILAKKSKTKVPVALWNGKIEIENLTIPVPQEARCGGYACIACPDGRSVVGIRNVLTAIGTPLPVFRIPGAGLTTLTNASDSMNVVEQAFLKAETSKIISRYPDLVVATHEGCAAYKGSTKTATGHIIKTWGRRPTMQHFHITGFRGGIIPVPLG
jgi:hypothetical protein